MTHHEPELPGDREQLEHIIETFIELHEQGAVPDVDGSCESYPIGWRSWIREHCEAYLTIHGALDLAPRTPERSPAPRQQASTRSIYLTPALIAAMLLIVASIMFFVVETEDPTTIPGQEDRQMAGNSFQVPLKDPITGSPNPDAPSPVDDTSSPFDLSGPDCIFEGVVMTAESQTPVPGAGVQLEIRLREDGQTNTIEEWVHTDDEGRFQLVHDAAFEVITATVAPGPTITVGQTIGPTSSPLPFRIAVPHESTIRGFVVDELNRPVRGARVMGWNQQRFVMDMLGLTVPTRQTTTDGAGAFEIVAIGSPFVITARAPGQVCRWRFHGELEPGQVIEGATLTLETERIITGLVLGPDLKPVEGVRVTAMPPWSGNSDRPSDVAERTFRGQPGKVKATSASDGTFSVAVGSVPYEFRVNCADHLPVVRTVAADQSRIEIQLQRGVTVSGHVFGPLGGGLDGAQVQYRTASRALGAITTRDQGFFEIDSIDPNERGALWVRAPGYAIAVEEIEFSGTENVRMDVALRPESVVSGVVLGPTGQPMVGVPIEVEGTRLDPLLTRRVYPPPTLERTLFLHRQESSVNGTFSFQHLPEGSYRLRAFDETGSVIATLQVQAPDDQVVLDLSSTRDQVILFGTVRDARTGEPIGNETVFMRSGRTRMDEIHSTDEDGRFEIRMTPGSARLYLLPRDHAFWGDPREEWTPGIYPFDIQLQPRRTLQCRVEDPAGQPVADATLHFRANGTPVMFLAGSDNRHSNLSTDSNGEVVARGLPPRLLDVIVKRPGIRQSFQVDLRQPVESWVFRLKD